MLHGDGGCGGLNSDETKLVFMNLGDIVLVLGSVTPLQCSGLPAAAWLLVVI